MLLIDLENPASVYGNENKNGHETMIDRVLRARTRARTRMSDQGWERE
jgi:hypothetical protein